MPLGDLRQHTLQSCFSPLEGEVCVLHGSTAVLTSREVEEGPSQLNWKRHWQSRSSRSKLGLWLHLQVIPLQVRCYFFPGFFGFGFILCKTWCSIGHSPFQRSSWTGNTEGSAPRLTVSICCSCLTLRQQVWNIQIPSWLHFTPRTRNI